MNKDAVAEMSQQYQVETAQKVVPEGYKQTEVGVIPEDWEVNQVQDLCGFIVPGRNKPRVFDGDIPWITTPDIDKRLIVNKSKSSLKISKEEAKFIGSKVVPAGSVVMSCVGELGIVCLVSKEVVINQQLHAFIPSVNLDSFYLLYSLQSKKDYFYSVATKTTLPYLNKENCNSTPIATPPNIEQKAIAGALFDIDMLLGELEKLIAKKQAIKTATMQQLLTGRTRLPQFAHHPDGSKKGYKQSELGEIPEDWEIVPLGKLANIKTGSKNNQDKVADGIYPFFVRSETVERLNSYSYECEAILVPGEGGIGSIFHYINGKFDAHQRVYVIREFVNCSGKYVYFQMRQRFGAHAMENSVKATVDSLRLPTFQEFSMFLPSIEEQTAIATILADMDEEIQALEHRLNKTRQIKQGMMQELLTGKTRLVASQSR